MDSKNEERKLFEEFGISKKEYEALHTVIGIFNELDYKESVPIMMTIIDKVADKAGKKGYELALELIPTMKTASDMWEMSKKEMPER